MGWRGKTYFTGHRDPTVWQELGLIGDRLSFTNDEVINKLGIGYITHVDCECAMDTAVRYELLNAGSDGEITAKDMLNHRTRLAALFEAGIVADGWYINEEGGVVRDWVYEKNYKQLHQNSISSDYSYNKAQFPADIVRGSKYYDYHMTKRHGWTTYVGWRQESIFKLERGDKLETIPFKGNERELYKVLDDKVVIRYINKALNRMVKSEKAIQLTQGRGRTFRWDSWGWLDRIRSRHMSSEAKKRKVGDTVNGWIYTRGNEEQHYGVAIYEHWWEPIEELKYYKVKLTSPTINYVQTYYMSQRRIDEQEENIKLPYVFFTKEDAQAYIDAITYQINAEQFNAIPISKTITADFDVNYSVENYQVVSYTPKIKVSCDAVIEDYLEPFEAWKELCTKGLQFHNLHKDKYLTIPSPIVKITKLESEIDERNE